MDSLVASNGVFRSRVSMPMPNCYTCGCVHQPKACLNPHDRLTEEFPLSEVSVKAISHHQAPSSYSDCSHVNK